MLKGPKADVEACKDHIIAEVERLARVYAESAVQFDHRLHRVLAGVDGAAFAAM